MVTNTVRQVQEKGSKTYMDHEWTVSGGHTVSETTGVMSRPINNGEPSGVLETTILKDDLKTRDDSEDKRRLHHTWYRFRGTEQTCPYSEQSHKTDILR